MPNQNAINYRPLVHRGFSLTEILFAIMILGVGLIMVAAMFPVAIQQSRVSSDETVATTVAATAVETIQQLALSNASQFTYTNAATPLRLFPTTMLNGICGNEREYGWCTVYRRDQISSTNPPFAQVWVFVARARTRSTFESTNDLVPRLDTLADVTVNIATGEGTITFTTNSDAARAAAEGGYVVTYDGSILRLGARYSGDIWNLTPDRTPAAGFTDKTVYLLGRDSSFSGPAQDIGCFVSSIRLN